MAVSGLTSRYQLAELCNGRDLTSYAVELGTDQGIFAHHFLSRWKGLRLYCVDLWQPYYERPWDRTADLMFAVQNLQEFSLKGRVTLIRRDIEFAAELLKTAVPRLDFVYIDADHSRAAKDIKLFYTLLCPGGILAGHDYSEEHYPLVVKAVQDHCVAHKLEHFIIKEDSGNSWYLFKS